jgi:hypothetical protein
MLFPDQGDKLLVGGLASICILYWLQHKVIDTPSKFLQKYVIYNKRGFGDSWRDFLEPDTIIHFSPFSRYIINNVLLEEFGYSHNSPMYEISSSKELARRWLS